MNMQPGWLSVRPGPGRPRSQIVSRYRTSGVSGVPVLGRVQVLISGLGAG